MLDEIYGIILDICDSRCVLCNKTYDCFHEIVPKSRRRNWHTVDNTVCICAECHEKVHRNGTVNSAEKLRSILYEKIHTSGIYDRIPREMFFDVVSNGEAEFFSS